ncbi:hypothetical protein LX32DRAFT_180495 [Colletotrichum zoysiae]|uniref:Uncharacterized protein n=1 Tax=Colletotrichum zoysiae TaxID=1216348 RepID=A0AAD9HNW3_9PEZI|nr:hypothetical protein LX32DRAFT_180495 [Colletotrichum zoysiae]
MVDGCGPRERAQTFLVPGQEITDRAGQGPQDKTHHHQSLLSSSIVTKTPACLPASLPDRRHRSPSPAALVTRSRRRQRLGHITHPLSLAGGPLGFERKLPFAADYNPDTLRQIRTDSLGQKAPAAYPGPSVSQPRAGCQRLLAYYPQGREGATGEKSSSQTHPSDLLPGHS